eukprot:476834-Rhodomonas_salina.3
MSVGVCVCVPLTLAYLAGRARSSQPPVWLPPAHSPRAPSHCERDEAGRGEHWQRATGGREAGRERGRERMRDA